jgi:hypothetical protein
VAPSLMVIARVEPPTRHGKRLRRRRRQPRDRLKDATRRCYGP